MKKYWILVLIPIMGWLAMGFSSEYRAQADYNKHMTRTVNEEVCDEPREMGGVPGDTPDNPIDFTGITSGSITWDELPLQSFGNDYGTDGRDIYYKIQTDINICKNITIKACVDGFNPRLYLLKEAPKSDSLIRAAINDTLCSPESIERAVTLENIIIKPQIPYYIVLDSSPENASGTIKLTIDFKDVVSPDTIRIINDRILNIDHTFINTLFTWSVDKVSNLKNISPGDAATGAINQKMELRNNQASGLVTYIFSPLSTDGACDIEVNVKVIPSESQPTPSPNFFIPNLVTTNQWRIEWLDAPNTTYRIQIFNRRGMGIYQSTINAAINSWSWDGFCSDGSTAPDGTYWYILYGGSNSDEIIRKGSVLLLRNND